MICCLICQILDAIVYYSPFDVATLPHVCFIQLKTDQAMSLGGWKIAFHRKKKNMGSNCGIWGQDGGFPSDHPFLGGEINHEINHPAIEGSPSHVFLHAVLAIGLCLKGWEIPEEIGLTKGFPGDFPFRIGEIHQGKSWDSKEKSWESWESWGFVDLKFMEHPRTQWWKMEVYFGLKSSKYMVDLFPACATWLITGGYNIWGPLTHIKLPG